MHVADCEWGEDQCNEVCTCLDIEEGRTVEPCKRCGPDVEYLKAVLAFHEPNIPPSTCMWCGLPSPCPPYLQAQTALARLT